MTTQNPLLPDLVEPKAIPDETHPEQLRAFEFALRDLPWAGTYAELLGLGYSWRKTAYIAWSIQPKPTRQPKYGKDFAKLIGFSQRTVSKWALDRTLQAEIFRLRQRVLSEAVPDVMEALVASATNSSYKHAPDRRVFLEMTGHYTPRQRMAIGPDTGDAGDFAHVSEAELERQAAMDLVAGEGDDE